ncbi:SAM-dependent methyltransferase [Actinoplanes tereljensis]|uniref:Transferase n=1 Tax=Paractinoplanes tereljensis TaxID=571912 RepID=A0A919NV61_9ACTN|nr:methyltransferase domain-containing protein [Actinoplanes tereljensis]GIF25313.1 transferase [Actinoplanes tereljensis]
MDYEELYRGKPPWEIGGPQPAIAAVLGEARGPKVLDIGCGSGDLAIALARLGHRVTGVDISATAIEQARAKAAGLDVHFEVQDAARLRLTNGPFDSIFDSGLLHWLARYDSGVDDYLALLPGLAAPGATVFVLAVFEAAGGGSWGVSEELLRDGFAAPDWTGTAIEETEAFADVDGQVIRHRAFLLRTSRTLGSVRTR